MSTPQPPRRRRIAGESKPGSPAPKTPVIKKAAKLRTPSKPAPPKPAPPKPSAPEAPSRPATPESSAAAEQRTRRFSLPRVSGRFAVLVALTVVAVAFGAVFGVRGFLEWRNDSSIVEAHEKAATTAASAGETIFTYQYNQLGEHLKDSKAIMTPSFGKKFESIAPALRNLAPQRKIQVKATVRNAAAIECGDKCSSDRATVLVFIDQARVADGAKEPTVFGNRIKLEMVNDDGSWLVNDIQAL
jgi:type IV secretory pathway VirB10-like protein